MAVFKVTRNERDKDVNQRAGRATYGELLHLWDKASGNLTDFSTHFSFVIDSMGNNTYADGLAFFLAPVDSTIKPHWSNGGGLGLGNRPGIPVDSTSLEAFVAVEFDTFKNNDSDPDYGDYFTPHVGIDINSMRSVNTTPWYNNISAGWRSDAWITYTASSKMVRVHLITGNSSQGIQHGSLSYEVDLRHYLPENVTVGFSAATGDLFETHNIISWSFNSTLPFNVSSIEPTANSGGKNSTIQPPTKSGGKNSTIEPPTESGGKNSKGSNRLLIVGLSVGLSILILASAFAFCCLWKKKYKELGDEDSSVDIEIEGGTEEILEKWES